MKSAEIAEDKYDREGAMSAKDSREEEKQSLGLFFAFVLRAHRAFAVVFRYFYRAPARPMMRPKTAKMTARPTPMPARTRKLQPASILMRSGCVSITPANSATAPIRHITTPANAI